MHDELGEAIEASAAETEFSGAVRIDSDGDTVFARAYGPANRAHATPNTLDTQFATASATKGLTALTVVSLVEDGVLELTTTARSLLRDDLPLIGDDVTVEHLLSHRSGIGDYLDEESELDRSAYAMPVPVHELARTEQYLAVLDGHPPKFAPGERFAYCNSGYVVLALLTERASGTAFHELVAERVCRPAEMTSTAFLRSDDLPQRAALGYVEMDGEERTNVFHLPVRGSGDGGIYSTVGDVSSFWAALFGGRIVAAHWLAEMTRPHSDEEGRRYGLGFWLEPGEAVALEGSDAGVSFRSVHDPARGLTHTVVSNTTEGAWPIARLLRDRLSGPNERPQV